MPEIKLTVDNPTLFAQQLEHAASHWDDGRATPVGQALHMAAYQIKQQAAPTVEGPTEFGSIVRAAFSERDERMLWQRTATGWIGETGGMCPAFEWLHEPEVLRVGIGGDWAWRNGYEQATKHTRERIYNRITALKPKLITAPEKTAIDKALAEIEKDVEGPA